MLEGEDEFDLTRAKEKAGVDILCAMERNGAEVRTKGFVRE